MHVVCFASWKELGAGRACVPVLPACQERLWKGAKASLMQRSFKCGHPSFPLELIWSPYLHHLCVFPLALWPGGWGRRKTLGWECLCAGFRVGACLAIGAISSLRSGLLRAGVALLSAQKDPHMTTTYPPGGELLQNPQWPKIHHGIMLQAVSELTAPCWLAQYGETGFSSPLCSFAHLMITCIVGT